MHTGFLSAGRALPFSTTAGGTLRFLHTGGPARNLASRPLGAASMRGFADLCSRVSASGRHWLSNLHIRFASLNVPPKGYSAPRPAEHRGDLMGAIPDLRQREIFKPATGAGDRGA